ncbi:MAG: toprim domain-containing protein [Candidatus Micrarchaeia archaeon]
MKKATPLLAKKMQRKMKLLSTALTELAESEAVVLVEGKRDKEALERIGVKNRIMVINMSPDRVCERVSKVADKAVILTDFDRTGEELCSRVEEELRAHNVLPNTEMRRKLQYILGLRNFEEIDRKLEEFREKIGD